MLEAAMAKLHVSQCFVQSSLTRSRFFGGYGWHDRAAGGAGPEGCRRQRPYSGTSEIQRNIIARRWGSSAGAVVMNDMKETIRQFILNTALPARSPANLRDDTPRAPAASRFAGHARAGELRRERVRHRARGARDGTESFDRIEDIAALVERKRALIGRLPS